MSHHATKGIEMKVWQARELQDLVFRLDIMLTRLQWTMPWDVPFTCPVCAADVRDGHQTDCKLATLLQETTGTETFE